MANAVITATGTIASADYKDVSWVGKTKGGKDVTIALTNAVNLGDIDLAFAEKDDTVASLTFTACYDSSDTNAEPWSITVADGLTITSPEEIILGAGVFKIGNTAIALTRGGGSFKVVREYRRINADGDKGAVKGRIVIDGAEATLTMNALTFLTRIADIYPGVTVSTAS